MAQALACGLFLLLAPFLLLAQSGEFQAAVVGQKLDTRSVVSPNGQVEFQVFVGQPSEALFSRLGFEIDYRGKPALAPSWIGLEFRDQEPYLGENAGLMSTDSGSDASGHYNYLVAHYMQNGTLGRKIDVEARAYDDGVAFRYFIPRTNPLADFYLRDDRTQFNFAHPEVLDRLPKQPDFDLPFVIQEPGIGWVAIESPESTKFPPTYLIRSGNGMLTNLPRSKSDPTVAFTAETPLAWIWRVVLVGPDRDRLLASDIPKNLDR